MNFSTALALLLWGQAQIRRASVPHLVYELDGAEGLRIWCHNHEDDDSDENATFGVTEVTATDWQTCPPRSTEFFPTI
jgi:hypothetical protein